VVRDRALRFPTHFAKTSEMDGARRGVRRDQQRQWETRLRQALYEHGEEVQEENGKKTAGGDFVWRAKRRA
jgi:hypothetical protein